MADGPQPKFRAWGIRGLIMAVLVGVYWGLGWLAFALGEPIDYTYKALLWPPVGLGVALLIAGGLRWWPVVTLGELLAHVTLGAARPLSVDLAVAAGTTLGMVLSAWLFLATARGDPSLERPPTVARFIVLAALVGPLASALVGTAVYSLVGITAWSDFYYVAWAWWSGDLVSILLLTPWLLAWRMPAPVAWTHRHAAEFAVMLSLLLVVSGFVFAGWLKRGSYDYPLTYLPVLVIAWGAARFGFREATSALLLVALVAVWGTLEGQGPFARPTRFETILLVQGFLGIVAATTLLLTALIVDRRRSERELARREAELASTRELDRMKDDLLNTTTHELRTPIAAILGNAELLEDGVPEPPTPTQLPMVQAIQAGARRLEKLVNDLLMIGGISAGTLHVSPHALELGGLLEHLVQAQAHQAHSHGVILVYTPPAAPIMVLADQERLIQALLHVIDNAIKFTPPGGRVEVVAGILGHEARVEIRDTGIGVAPEHLARIFDRFYQVEPSMTRSHGGVGLGLAIARALVEAQAGRLGVESVAGAGSTFWVTLPLSVPGSPGAVTWLPESADRPASSDL